MPRSPIMPSRRTSHFANRVRGAHPLPRFEVTGEPVLQFAPRRGEVGMVRWIVRHGKNRAVQVPLVVDGVFLSLRDAGGCARLAVGERVCDGRSFRLARSTPRGIRPPLAGRRSPASSLLRRGSGDSSRERAPTERLRRPPTLFFRIASPRFLDGRTRPRCPTTTDPLRSGTPAAPVSREPECFPLRRRTPLRGCPGRAARTLRRRSGSFSVATATASRRAGCSCRRRSRRTARPGSGTRLRCRGATCSHGCESASA